MNKITATLLLFLFFQISTAQNETITAMKAQMEEMTKQISRKESFTYTIFKENMVPIELLRKAADAPELRMSQENKAIVKSLKREGYNKLLKEDYDAVIATAKSYNINWKKVEYVELLYKSKTIFKLGQPGFEGLLVIEDKTQKDVLFTLRVDFIMLGTDPYILEMDDFKKEVK